MRRQNTSRSGYRQAALAASLLLSSVGANRETEQLNIRRRARLTFSSKIGEETDLFGEELDQIDEVYWVAVMQAVGSMPTVPPTISPTGSPTQSPTSSPSTGPPGETPEPTDSPSAPPSSQPSMEPPSASPTASPSMETQSPSQTPSDFPSQVPSQGPSSQPSNEASDSPSTEPSVSPSSMPTLVESGAPSDSPAPSSAPSTTPSQRPSDVPSIAPTDSSAPSEAPTRICEIDTSFRCVVTEGETPCEDITGEEDLTCFCADCVQSLQFRYTGNNCDNFPGQVGECTDFQPASDTVRLVVGNMTNPFFDEVVELEDIITVTSIEGCLPDSINIMVLDETDASIVFQTLTLDVPCDSNGGLELLDSFGAVDFVGYGCDAIDVHSCFVDVVYFIRTCNDDASDDLILFNMDFALNETRRDLLPGGLPLTLEPTQCFQSFLPSLVERCVEREYFASIFSRASFEFGGPFCTDGEVIVFDTLLNSTANATLAPAIVNGTRRTTELR